MNDLNERTENPSFFLTSWALPILDSPNHEAQQRFLEPQSDFGAPNLADFFAYNLVIPSLSMLQHSFYNKHTATFICTSNLFYFIYLLAASRHAGSISDWKGIWEYDSQNKSHITIFCKNTKLTLKWRLFYIEKWVNQISYEDFFY